MPGGQPLRLSCDHRWGLCYCLDHFPFPTSFVTCDPSEDTSQVWGRQLLPITVVLSPCHLGFQNAQTTMCKPRAISDFDRGGCPCDVPVTWGRSPPAFVLYNTLHNKVTKQRSLAMLYNADKFL